MCGILGVKIKNTFEPEEYHKLMTSNEKRGKAATAYFNTPNGMFFHFRAPTSGCSLHNLSEAYPLTYKGWGLIGNGVINEKYFKSIKDEDNNNDLYYILKGVVENGWEFLEEVDGCFALAFFNPEGKIYLVRNTFPLFQTNEIFSSVNFDGAYDIYQGVVIDWTDDSEPAGKAIMQLKLKESPFLI